MDIQSILRERSRDCELCRANTDLSIYSIPPASGLAAATSLLICKTCFDQIEGKSPLNPNHWRCLTETMWSEHAPVQVMAWRMLQRLKDEAWARELSEQLYLEDSLLEFAQSGLEVEEEVDEDAPTLDSNGTRLLDGDSVTLIKDLDVKGGGFTAKRGTLVKNISLTNNPKHVEGKVNGIQIVLVAAYLKKA